MKIIFKGYRFYLAPDWLNPKFQALCAWHVATDMRFGFELRLKGQTLCNAIGKMKNIIARNKAMEAA